MWEDQLLNHIHVILALFCPLHLLKERIKSIKNLLNMNYGCCDGYNGDHRKEQFSKDQAAPSQRSIKNIDDYA